MRIRPIHAIIAGAVLLSLIKKSSAQPIGNREGAGITTSQGDEVTNINRLPSGAQEVTYTGVGGEQFIQFIPAGGYTGDALLPFQAGGGQYPENTWLYWFDTSNGQTEYKGYWATNPDPQNPYMSGYPSYNGVPGFSGTYDGKIPPPNSVINLHSQWNGYGVVLRPDGTVSI